MPTWSDFFSPRQLLAIGEISVSREAMLRALREQLPADKARAIEVYTGLMLDKVAIYNNHNCRFDPGRGIRSIFDRHDFAFVSSHAEFDASANLLPWVIDQVADSYREMAALLAPSQVAFGKGVAAKAVEKLQITCGSASSLHDAPDGFIHNITVDPPYYDNVQYAELSDFFYVWLKRSVGHLFPDWFADELTDKDDEAVANPARFEALGGKKRELANQDYERKMAAAFREMHRVLRPDGVLTVMFTHRRVEAWDTLASALIGAGFVIKASWPVHTESEHSLHIAKKNAASSTILLACRKRVDGETARQESAIANPVWWDDLQGKVRATARAKAEEFAAAGIGGVDLYLSTFGPTLSIISEHWPVLTSEIDPKTGQPRPLRPETALDLARQEVVRLRKERLLGVSGYGLRVASSQPGTRNSQLATVIQFDPVTDWYLMAWADFAAEQFPYDEARKLAIALGVDLDKTIMAGKRLVTKKGEFVVLQTPVQRRRKGVVDDEVLVFESWIDAAHTAMMVYEEDGAGACDAFLRRSGLRNDGAFRALLQALLNAIPRSRVKGKFVRPEAEVLENMRLAFFDDLVAPAEEEPEIPGYVQMGLPRVGEESAPYFAGEEDEE
jgi:putative DNA methylase